MYKKKPRKQSNNTKIRISVPLSEDCYKWCAERAEMYGVSLPTYIAYIVGESLNKK